MIGLTERQDFETELRRRRLSPADFEMTEEELPPPPEAFQPNTLYSLRSRVVVRHIKSGRTQKYAGGSGTNWVVDFADELDAGRWSTT